MQAYLVHMHVHTHSVLHTVCTRHKDTRESVSKGNTGPAVHTGKSGSHRRIMMPCDHGQQDNEFYKLSAAWTKESLGVQSARLGLRPTCCCCPTQVKMLQANTGAIGCKREGAHRCKACQAMLLFLPLTQLAGIQAGYGEGLTVRSCQAL